MGLIKINVDGSVAGDRAGCATMARDRRGHFVVRMREPLLGVIDAAQTETQMGLLRLDLAVVIHPQPFLLECDNARVVNMGTNYSILGNHFWTCRPSVPYFSHISFYFFSPLYPYDETTGLGLI